MALTNEILYKGFNSDSDLDFQRGVDLTSITKQKIHVRFQKTGPRSITLIEGLDADLDIKRISKAMKRAFNCSSSIHADKEGNEVIKLQGDQCRNVRDWLVSQEILTEKEAAERLITHGM